MKRPIATMISSALFGSSLLLSSAASAEFTGNVGVTSNYLWRGMTQTDNMPAVSGGLDAEMGGLSFGTWVSNVTDGYEVDFYAAYGGDIGAVSYSVGAIYYMYPVGDVENDFTEVNASLGFGPVTASVAYTVSKEMDTQFENDLYYSLGAEFEVSSGLTLSGLVGYYDWDNDPSSDDDMTHYQLALAKDLGDFGGVTFAFDDTDADDSDALLTVSWSKSFDL